MTYSPMESKSSTFVVLKTRLGNVTAVKFKLPETVKPCNTYMAWAWIQKYLFVQDIILTCLTWEGFKSLPIEYMTAKNELVPWDPDLIPEAPPKKTVELNDEYDSRVRVANRSSKTKP